MKKTIFATLVALIAVLALAGPASAQAPNCPVDNPTFYDPDGVCPNVIDRPPAGDPDVAPVAALPRTGSSDSLPLAKMAIVLIGVGGALTLLASRKRRHAVPA